MLSKSCHDSDRILKNIRFTNCKNFTFWNVLKSFLFCIPWVWVDFLFLSSLQKRFTASLWSKFLWLHVYTSTFKVRALSRWLKNNFLENNVCYKTSFVSQSTFCVTALMSGLMNKLAENWAKICRDFHIFKQFLGGIRKYISFSFLQDHCV